MSEIFIKATQQDRCSDTVNYTLGTLQDLYGNRKTKDIKQLNADLNNPIASFLKTLAVPSGGMIPDRLLKLPFVRKAPRCRESTARAKAPSCGSDRKPSEAPGPRCHRPQHHKNPTKSRAKPLAACPTPLRCHQLVLGASKGRMKVEAALPSFAPGAGRGRALSAAPALSFPPELRVCPSCKLQP